LVVETFKIIFKMRKILVLIIFLMFVSGIHAQTDLAKAQSMFIYNFSRLIEWPANYKTGPFIIGVIGSSSVADELKAYTTGKAVGSQPIMIKIFKTPAEISACHILFVSFSETKQLQNILAQLSSKNTLLITEKNGAIDQGSAINFVVVGDKLKFELSPNNATKYDIKISSKLSEMAYRVF
jgi:hypothetical protein